MILNDGGMAVLEQPETAPSRGGAARATWNVIAFLAGDNNLEESLLDDLREMERVGSRPGVVDIVAQIDRPKGARRYYVSRSTSPTTIGSKLIAELGPTNTGDPRVLEAFVT